MFVFIEGHKFSDPVALCRDSPFGPGDRYVTVRAGQCAEQCATDDGRVTSDRQYTAKMGSIIR
jgi:hypothetical protein